MGSPSLAYEARREAPMPRRELFDTIERLSTYGKRIIDIEEKYAVECRYSESEKYVPIKWAGFDSAAQLTRGVAA